MKMEELLDILACPACHGDLELLEKDGKADAFFCRQCDLVYPIENDIPIMLVSRAFPYARWEKGEN